VRAQAIALLFVLTASATLPGCAPGNDAPQVGIAFYNCENLFDTIHNPNKDDVEFTPGGKYHYTQKIYEQKIHNIATVFQSMGGDDGPAIIGMAEVENSNVLNDLVRQPELAKRHYKYEWFDGPDPRGINVAMLYNPKLFRVLNSEPLHVDLSGMEGKIITRDVLHVQGILCGDTVHVFVNHWPSRTGGEEESAPKRGRAARVDKNAIDALLERNPATKIIVMGDFNDNPTDSSIAVILAAKGEQSKVSDTDLYNPWADIYKTGAGTEQFRDSWNLFDQIIVSGSLLQNKNHKLGYGKAEIYKPNFIIDHYKGHEGEPHRSFVGPHWINGYSDHFPVMLYFKR